MNKIKKQILIILSIILFNVIKTEDYCNSQCQSCGTRYIYESYYFQYGQDIHYLECSSCKPDVHRKSNLNTCNCDKGYYYDGIKCERQKIGLIYMEDFEGPDPLNSNWNLNQDGQLSAYIASKDFQSSPNKAVRFRNQRSEGDIFYKKYYQSIEYGQFIQISFDYLDSTPQNDCNLQYGYSTFEKQHGRHTWYHSTNHQYLYDMPKTIGDKWTHFEDKIPCYFDVPISLMLHDFNPLKIENTNNDCYFDNIQVMSGHGLPEINFSPYSILQPTIMILSLDYDGYTGGKYDQKFSFDSAEMDRALGFTNWNGRKFAVYIYERRSLHQEQIILHRDNSKGFTHGDAYAEFAMDPTDHYYIGIHAVFSSDLTEDKNNFILETGTCSFKGPFTQYTKVPQNLENCFDDCKDYDKVEVAMQECLKNKECDGVTFSHKLWGGDKSTGFTSLHNYGYQLRKNGTTPNEYHESRGFVRQFEHSWRKQLIVGKYQIERNLVCNDCNIKCKNCVTSADNCLECGSDTREGSNCQCKAGYLDTGLADCKIKDCSVQCESCFKIGECLSCKVGTGRNLIKPTCGCSDGFYVITNQLNCGVCNNQCAKCSNSSDCNECKDANMLLPNCTICKNGYYKDAIGHCQQCNSNCESCSQYNQCDTCKVGQGRNMTPPECGCMDSYFEKQDQIDCIQCDQGCKKCLESGKCYECKDSYFLEI